MAIDYVVPMVFPEDLTWRHDYITANGCLQDDKTALCNVRYRTWHTEHLLVKCIQRFLPWVRDIIILLARPSQVQEWMKTPQPPLGGAKVRLVFHRDFMPADKLPTFNSRSIEMYLHRIPGLSDYFLYGNDDMFPLAHLVEEDFFQDGLPCFRTTMKSYNPDSSFHKACLNGMNFVAREFGKQFSTGWIHTGHCTVPMLRKTCEMFWRQWPKEMENSVTTFRSVQNLNQYIYSWWHILSGQYIQHAPKRDYVSTNNTIDEVREAIRSAQGILCINDNEAVDDIRPYAEAVRSEIEAKVSEYGQVSSYLCK